MKLLDFTLANYLHQQSFLAGKVIEVKTHESLTNQLREEHFVLHTFERIFPEDFKNLIKNYYEEMECEVEVFNLSGEDDPAYQVFRLEVFSDFINHNVIVSIENDFQAEILIEDIPDFSSL